MSQTALYRKWRPQSFTTIVGQKAIVTTLRNAVREQRTTHAYLFSGPRGTGKTSTARIFAKAVNCLELQDGEPCNRCRACTSITQGTELDVIEIDAATHTGVDNIRELTEQLYFVPLEVRKKVVIIDEVHMLTTNSFNALLKSLEEPPEHVIFILATTEMHKVLPTIISRCQRFEFKSINIAEQVEHIKYICKEEKIEMTDEAIHYLARLSDGGMRDALSLLDQTVSFAGRNIRVDHLISVTGGLQFDQYALFFDALRVRDVAQMLDLVSQWLEQGKNAGQTLHNLIEFFRDMLVFKLLPQSIHAQSLFADESWKKKIEAFALERIYHAIKVLSEFVAEIKYAAHPQTVLELALIKLCAAVEAKSTSVSAGDEQVQLLQQRIHQLELQVQQMGKELKGIRAQASVPRPFLKVEPQQVQTLSVSTDAGGLKLADFIAAQNSQMTKKYLLDWPRVMNAVKQESVSLHAWMKEGQPISFLEKGALVVFHLPIHCEATNKPPNKALLERKVADIYGHPMKVTAVLLSEWNAVLGKQKEAVAEPLQIEPEHIDDTAQKPAWVSEALDMFGDELVEIKNEGKGDFTNEQH